MAAGVVSVAGRGRASRTTVRKPGPRGAERRRAADDTRADDDEIGRRRQDVARAETECGRRAGRASGPYHRRHVPRPRPARPCAGRSDRRGRTDVAARSTRPGSARPGSAGRPVVAGLSVMGLLAACSRNSIRPARARRTEARSGAYPELEAKVPRSVPGHATQPGRFRPDMLDRRPGDAEVPRHRRAAIRRSDMATGTDSGLSLATFRATARRR